MKINSKLLANFCAFIVLFGLTWPLFEVYPYWITIIIIMAFGYLLGWLLAGD